MLPAAAASANMAVGSSALSYPHERSATENQVFHFEICSCLAIPGGHFLLEKLAETETLQMLTV